MTSSFPVLEQMAREPDFLPAYAAISAEVDQFYAEDLFPHDLDQMVGQYFYEFWNEEYIAALGLYLAGRAAALGANAQAPCTVAEVGAGNGRLAHYLRERLAALAPDSTAVVATDSGQNGIQPDFPVETATCAEALDGYRPSIVVWSWMPAGEDLTYLMRRAPSVQEYLLIGQGGYTPLSGDAWSTWGAYGGDTAYGRDGFEQVPVEELSRLQVSRARLMNDTCTETSTTTSFRRVAAVSIAALA